MQEEEDEEEEEVEVAVVVVAAGQVKEGAVSQDLQNLKSPKLQVPYSSD